MNNRTDKYPAHNKIDDWKRRTLFADSVKLCEAQDVVDEFQALLQRQQSDEGVIEKLKAFIEADFVGLDEYEAEWDGKPEHPDYCGNADDHAREVEKYHQWWKRSQYKLIFEQLKESS